MPDVLDAVRVAAVRRGVEGLDHGSVVGHDLSPRRRDRGDPSIAVGPRLPVVSDVGLVPRAVGQIAIAVPPDPVVPDRIDRVRARRDRLGLHRLHRPRSGNLPQAVEVALEPEPGDQALGAAVRVAARGEVELDRPARVGEAVEPDRVGLGDEHPGAGVGIRQEQVLRWGAPGATADQDARRVADRVRVLLAPHDPRVTGPDRSEQPTRERRPDPQTHPVHLGREMDHGPLGGEPDPDARRERRCRIHAGPLVEVRQDLPMSPAHGREPVGSPLRHPEPVAVTRSVEGDRPGRAGGHLTDGKRERSDQGGREEHAEASSHRSGIPVAGGPLSRAAGGTVLGRTRDG